MTKWGQYTTEYKVSIVERMKECANVSALAAELQISRQALYRWKEELEGEVAKKRPSSKAPAQAELRNEILDLKLALADKTLEASFFRGALQRVEDRRRKRRENGGSGSTIASSK